MHDLDGLETPLSFTPVFHSRALMASGAAPGACGDGCAASATSEAGAEIALGGAAAPLLGESPNSRTGPG